MTKSPARRALLSLIPFLLLAALPPGAAAPIPAAPQIGARAYLLLDFDSGAVLVESNADERMEPASITKIMTSYVVYHELAKGSFTLDTLVTVSEKAWRMGGSRMFIEVGKQVSVLDLLRGLVIQSGNDASVALAELVAGSEEAFADLMNIHAARLGMTNSNFLNSTGWPHAEHYTSARDVALLARALIREFPEHYAMYAERQFTFNSIVQYNRNKLLWRDETIDGIKTGHTEAAGYCLVTSAKRDGMRLISVILGSAGEDSRATQSQQLLGYGFRFFETHRLYSAEEVLREARIWRGAEETLPLGLGEDLYVTIPRGQYKRLKAALQIQDDINAPAARLQALGSVRVSLEGEVIEERPLLALRAVAEGGLWQRTRDAVLQLFQ